MANLTIMQSGETFKAGVDNFISDEMHGLTGDIYNLWVSASDLLKKDSNDIPEFNFEEFSYSCDEYKARWNSDLDGYVITFADGKVAHTQTYVEHNRLHARFGETYLERYTEYDSELSDEQNELVDNFVYEVNLIKAAY